MTDLFPNNDLRQAIKEVVPSLRYDDVAEPWEPVGDFREKVLLYWRIPAFRCKRTWTVMSTTANSAAPPLLIREITDSETMGYDPQDSPEQPFSARYRIAQALAEDDSVQSLLDRARTIAIPSYDLYDYFGLDGAMSGIEFPGGYLRVKLEWWCNGPEKLWEFTSWADELRMVLRGYIRCLHDEYL